MREDSDVFNQDLENAINNFRQRLFTAQHQRETKEAKRTLNKDIARPALIDSLQQLLNAFEIRLKKLSEFPPGTPIEYEEAFMPLLKRIVTLPPPDRHLTITFDLWTQHVVFFQFAYGMEPLFAMLGVKAFILLSPSPKEFHRLISAKDKTEQQRKTNEVVDKLCSDIVACVQHSCDLFVDSLCGRLGSIVDETVNEIIIRSISELLPKLNNVGQQQPADIRHTTFKIWQDVEKTRLETPRPGAPTFNKKAEFQSLIDDAQKKLRPAGLSKNKTAVVQYINTSYPHIRCSSVKQLNRLLTKFGLESKFSDKE